jgi:hypothetical protein
MCDQAELRPGCPPELRQLTPVDEQPGLLSGGKNPIQRRFQIRTVKGRQSRIRKHGRSDGVTGSVRTKTGLDELPEVCPQGSNRI